MSFGSPISVDPSSPTQPLSGKPARKDDINLVLRNLERRVKALEDELARITRQGGGLTLTSPNGVHQKTLSIDDTGSVIWT